MGAAVRPAMAHLRVAVRSATVRLPGADAPTVLLTAARGQTGLGHDRAALASAPAGSAATVGRRAARGMTAVVLLGAAEAVRAPARDRWVAARWVPVRWVLVRWAADRREADPGSRVATTTGPDLGPAASRPRVVTTVVMIGATVRSARIGSTSGAAPGQPATSCTVGTRCWKRCGRVVTSAR